MVIIRITTTIFAAAEFALIGLNDKIGLIFQKGSIPQCE